MALIFPITYQCNLNCFYCSEKNKKHITVNIEKGIELISKNINEWIYITGGEPLLVSNIVDMSLPVRPTQPIMVKKKEIEKPVKPVVKENKKPTNSYETELIIGEE